MKGNVIVTTLPQTLSQVWCQHTVGGKKVKAWGRTVREEPKLPIPPRGASVLIFNKKVTAASPKMLRGGR